ncbi:MAG: hypothetical protein HYZ43_03555, partial [Flavobacteriia bacterium]|nr:hypothetical protein [Flavobacteriia bacterium]
MKKFILIVLLLLSSVQFSKAAVESFVERKEGNQLVVSSAVPAFTVFDDKYAQMATNPSWTSVFTNYKVKNLLRVGINPDAPQVDDLSGSITFTLKYWKWNSSTSSFVITTETNRVLSLMYSFSNPNAIIDEIASYSFNDAHKVEVYITAITGATFDVNDVFVSSEIEVERYYSLNSSAVTGLGISVPSDNTEYYQFDWSQKEGAEYYELEWVHVSDATLQSGVYKTTSNLKYDYYLNSTRIVVRGNSYRIPRIFDRGYLVFRIRPIGLVGTGFKVRKEGTWTNTSESGTIAGHLAANVLFINADYDVQMNWSHQVAYGDNGERFESVSFADGLGRGRQSVGHNTETQQAVVSNVYYDELGRPVIGDLPTPVDGEVLRHKKNFNLANVAGTPSYQQLYFDVVSEDVCNPVAGGFATSSGSGQYYSSSNPDQDGENKRIPDAENFPLSRVTYRNDFTGRVDKISGVGDDLKIGSGKETSFAYPSPNQAELDRLFGAEVGQASHYEKMVTIDANGQIYIQYSDMAGRVVASYMA